MKFCSLIIRLFLLLLGSVFLLVLCLAPILVTSGFHLDQLSLANISAQDITLTWKKGLDLEVGTVEVDPQEGAAGIRMSARKVRRGLHTVHYLSRFISSCTINSLRYKKYHLQLLKQEQESRGSYLLTLKGENLHLTAILTREQENYRILLQEFSSQQYRSSATGSFLFDTRKTQLNGELRANLADCLPVQLKISSDLKSISFQGRDAGEITSIKSFVELFGLSHNIQRWITDYLSGSRYHLQEISGNIPWQNPAAILDTLAAKIRVDDCAYTFAAGLEPIKTEYTDVTFSKGVLHIDPHGSSFYGQHGEKSRLDIDFNDADNILLTVYIKTNARANADIIRLLEYYNIPLPFLQTSGKISTDLTLAINLNTEQVQAAGKFDLGEGEFSYKGKSYRVRGGRIELQGTDIVIDDLELGFNTLFSARIDGKISFTEARTDLDIAVESFALPLKKHTLALESSTRPLRLSYHLWAGLGILAVQPSSWILANEQLQLDAISMPFDLQQLSGKLPATRLVVPGMADLLLEGDFNGKKQRLDMQATLRHLQTRTVALAATPLVLDVNYDGKLSLSSHEESVWQFSGKELTLSPVRFWYGEDQLSIEKTHMHAGLFDTSLQGKYNFISGKGTLLLDELLVAEKDQSPLFQVPTALRLEMEKNQGGTRVDIDELGLSLQSKDQGVWGVELRDIGMLGKHSRLLKRLKIKGGSLQLVTASPSTPLRFSGELSSSYAFLVQGDQPQSDYVFSGIYTDTGFDLVINKDVRMHWGEDITIISRTLGFNIPALLHFKKDRPEEQPSDVRENDFPDITLEAEKSFLFFRKENRILADSMILKLSGNKLDWTITHGQGEIVVKVVDDAFSLKGQKLDDQFMNALIAEAQLEGGHLTAFAEGTFDEFNAVFQTDKFLLKNYAMLNNMLAVINTLPALVTFSMPNYDRDGWPVDSMLLGFDYEQGVATVKTMELDSAEMDLRGAGTVDPRNQQVDLKINMITQAGQNVSHIPLVGYILAGKEQRPTLTWHVTGDLLDPKVDNTAFEEVGTMPFKMIVRTLKSPFHWADTLSDHGADGSGVSAEPGEDEAASSTILPSEK